MGNEKVGKLMRRYAKLMNLERNRLARAHARLSAEDQVKSVAAMRATVKEARRLRDGLSAGASLARPGASAG